MIGFLIASALVAAGGLAAGALHVLSGPDHLAAVAPLVTASRHRPWRSGLIWAAGHSGGVLLVALAALALRGLLAIDSLSSFSERLVGGALVCVGLWTLARALGMRVHVHAHGHGGASHRHVHLHAARTRHVAAVEDAGHDHVHAALSFGVLHGFAGSSHLFGVVPALALPMFPDAAMYLAGYGAGTIVAMTAFSSAIGRLAHGAHAFGPRAYRALLCASSAAAVIVGCVWLFT
jgi:hypothetical protein